MHVFVANSYISNMLQHSARVYDDYYTINVEVQWNFQIELSVIGTL